MSGYIGTQPVPQATQTRDSFTATSGQTSFSCSGYTPNFLDVFLNGVKLASADYTATNGSDVVLASGAATGDILEVVAFTTFTPADLPAGTPSIDDNGNAVALTIDSSENVLINGTSTTPWSLSSGSGAVIRSEGYAGFASSSAAIELNRIGSDGNIANFRKDGTSVGSIGVNSGDQVYFAASDGMGIKVDTDNTSVEASNAAGADNDNAVNLGSSGTRWKDLYLSGGVYLGGTGSANYLDDYEEGTWTPVPTFGGSTAGIAASVSGSYTKIGRQVNLYWTCTFTNLGSATGEVSLGGVPFTSTNISHINSGFSYIHRLTLSSLTQLASSLDGGNEIKFRIAGINTGNASNLTSTNLHYTSAIHGAISYQTNS